MKTIKELRTIKKITQIDLANKTGLSLAWVRSIEQGAAQNVSEEAQKKIAKALGEFPADFLEDAGAYREDELWSEPNPIITEPLRVFIMELEKRAREKSYSDQIAQIESWRKRGTWVVFQQMLFAAKRLGLKLPKV